MAQRALWTGAISFGLVNVPVKMYTAQTERSIRFNQINSATGNRVKQPKVDAKTGNLVAPDQIVKGFEVTKDRYVILDPEELVKLAPAKTKQITVEKFVDADEIDPLLVRENHWLGPNDGGPNGYALLMAAMVQSGKVGIGRVVIREKERLVALRIVDGAICMTSLAWSNEINDPTPLVNEKGALPDPNPAQLAHALTLIDAMSDTLDHAEYVDDFRAQVEAMIEAKAAGEQLPQGDDGTPVESGPDLMSALEASLAEVKPKAAKPKAKPKASKPRKTKVAA